MNKWRRSLTQALIHSLLWGIGVFVAVSVMSHSSARMAYGYLTGWWLALYVGYIAKFDLLSSLIAGLIYIAGGILSVIYKGSPEIVSFNSVFVLLFDAFVFCSPILINNLVWRMNRMARRR